jgi:hypothetical protein
MFRTNSTLNTQIPELALVAHADWGSQPRKRWLAIAQQLHDGRYLAYAPVPAGEPGTLLARLLEAARGGAVLAAFDFPFGLPARYAAHAGIDDFVALLPILGSGRWADFYRVAAQPDEISITRPFYPLRPGNARQRELIDALGMETIDDLRRRCDRAHAARRAGAPLFWTLGAQQVGKATIGGWRDMVAPAMQAGLDMAIWPFGGPLFDALRPGRAVLAETYPGECYAHLQVVIGRGGKRAQAARVGVAHTLLSWAERAGVLLDAPLRTAIANGFGPSPDGEDPFDTTVGLFGTLNVALGLRAPGDPNPADLAACTVEGWILGQHAGQ